MANKKMKKKQQMADLQDNSKLLVKDSQSANAGKESDIVEDMSENLDRFEMWAIANGKYILILCVLILIGVAIFLSVLHWRNQSIAAGTAKLANAAKIDQLEQALKETSASVPGYDMAQIRLARLYAAEKKYDQAFNCYVAVAERKNEPYLSARSRLDSAYIKELAGKTADAAAIFALVADTPEILPDLRAEGAYAAGRLFLALKNETAARKYLSMTDPMKASSQVAAQWGMLAQALLNRRLAATPKTAAPAAKKASTSKTAVPAAKKASTSKTTVPAGNKVSAPKALPAAKK